MPAKSLIQSLREGQISVGNGWRGYYAPFNKVAALAAVIQNVGPAMLDLQNGGPFTEAYLNGKGFYDTGFCRDIKTTNGTKFGAIKTGHRNVVRAMYAGDLDEKLEVTFAERSRIVDQISSGMQVFNLLKNSTFTGTLTSPLGASGTTATPLAASGYLPAGVPATSTAGYPTLCVPAGSGALFAAGEYIVCDVDYVPGQGGYQGDAAALAFPGQVQDVDFIRKTSDYVNRIVAVVPTVVAGMDALVLSGPFVGGGNNLIVGSTKSSPSASAKVQIITGTTRRNGGSKINEWTGLFLLDTEDGSQFAMYYPRLAPSAPKGLTASNITDATGLSEWGMNTEFQALAFDDPYDGEAVTSYLAYYPNAGQNIQI